MFVASFVYTTGSCSEWKIKNTDRLDKNGESLIALALAVDTIISGVIVVIGVIAFMRGAPKALASLPLYGKITIIGTGAVFAAFNVSYAAFRVIKLTRQIKSEGAALKKSVLREMDNEELRASEIIQDMQSYISHLEKFLGVIETKLRENEERLASVSESCKAAKNQQSKRKSVSDFQNKLLACQQKIKSQIERCKSVIGDNEQMIGELGDNRETFMKELHALLKEV